MTDANTSELPRIVILPKALDKALDKAARNIR